MKMKMKVKLQDFIVKCLPGKSQQKSPLKSPLGFPRDAFRRLPATIEALEFQGPVPPELASQLEKLKCLIQSLADSKEAYSVVEDSIDVVEDLLIEDIFVKFVEKLGVFDVSQRTLVVNLCSVLLQLGLPHGLDTKVVNHICMRDRLFELLLHASNKEDVSAHAGSILRSCLKHQEIAKVFLESSHVFRLLNLAQSPCFEISTDAFSSLRDALLVHRKTAAEWLFNNKIEFFRLYHEMLEGGDYVVQRQALKLLSEMLLDRSNQSLMRFYVADERHLRIHMNLLRDCSRRVQFEAFHVFKLFVANPQKPIRVQKILGKNQVGLIELVDNMQPSISSDEQFFKDKKCVIDKLEALPGSLPTLTLKDTKGERGTSPYAASDASTSTGLTTPAASQAGMSSAESNATTSTPGSSGWVDIDSIVPEYPLYQSL